MANPGDFKNNPLYSDITQLDHLSPQPVFQYFWNKESGRWEPQGKIDINVDNLNIDLSSTNEILSGISGELSNIHVDVEIDSDTTTHKLLSGISGSLDSNTSEDTKTHALLSGISGELSNIHVDVEIDSDTETHALLSGISGELSSINDLETHRILSGISGELSNIHVDVEIDSDTATHELLSGVIDKLNHIGGEIAITGGNLSVLRKDTQPWKLRTKTINQKIEEDFILLESIPNELRFGIDTGSCYGTNKNLMDDVYGTYFRNGRLNISEQETGHPDYFIHAEYTDPDRCVESYSTFHSDSQFSMRQENVSASLINSYELEDCNELYERGLMDHVVIYNESSHPIQFHTADRRLNRNEPVSPKNEDLIYLDSDMAVKIENDEAARIFVKRPHTVSGYTVKYSIIYKVTGDNDVIK
jgi:hypothetical protein